MDIRKAIQKVAGGSDLAEKEAYAVFNGIMSGVATPAQIGALITAMRMKGETVGEITGAARVMREKALKVRAGGAVMDTCGTGGTGINTFNVSTIVALVLAACGVKVAKHGNRAASGRCGSADVLEELGVRLDVPVKTSEKCIREINIGFLFAPFFHGAMRYAIGPRREIGMRTIFNVLGPLSNPASARRQVIGVYDEALTEVMARVLGKLGSERVCVVHGADGLDEVTITGKTRIAELRNGRIRSYAVTPGTFGVKRASLRDIRGGSASTNARIARAVLSGKKGPRRDMVLMNASLALMTAGKARDAKEGMLLAARAIDSGLAMEKLGQLIKMTNAGRPKRKKK